MSLTLITDAGNFRAFKILIAAEYNGLVLDIPAFSLADAAQPAFLAKSPRGTVPVLETPQGALFESNAIARYVARIRSDSGLCGASFYESGLVDAWVDFCAHAIELPATLWFYPCLGLLPHNPAVCAKAKADLASALAVLEKHLADKTFLVGHKVTLADITLVSALVYPFKFVCDPAFRAPFPSVMRWFETCVNQPQFEAVVGSVTLAAKELTPSGVPAIPAASSAPKEEKKAKAPKESKPKEEKPKEEKPKEEKKKAAKEDDDEPEPDYVEEKKQDHPFKLLDKSAPSTFVMDTWKKTYSNCGGDYKGAMDTFWSTFDAAGWSIFRGDYQYNEENKMLFMTSNLIGGFMQRTEEIRKWLFGTMTIRGEEGGLMKVSAYYLIRGDSIQPLISCNDDAAYYTWTKMEMPASDADKAMLFEHWCAEEELEGEKLLDSRCYK